MIVEAWARHVLISETADISFASNNIKLIIKSCKSKAVDRAEDRYSFLLLNVIKS